MKKIILSGLLFATGFSAQSQIELKKEHFATKGAQERMSSAATDTPVDLQTGAGYFWDFSHLTPQNQTVEEYKPISDLGSVANIQFGNYSPDKYKGTYYLLNPDVPLQYLPSFLPIQFSDYNNVFRLTEDSLSLIGITVSVNGQTLPSRYSVIETPFRFPVKYLDHDTTYGKFDLDMNPIYDAKWRQKRQHEVNVDGWGKAFTPLGSFDVLRIKHTVVEQDSIYASVNGFGMWIPLNVPKQNIYEWRTTSEGSPVVRIKANINGNNETITAIEYRDDNVFVGLNELNNTTLSVYPNPVFNVLKVATNTSFEQFEIIGIDGKIVQKAAFTSEIDCSHLQSGAYVLRLMNKDGMVTKSFVKE